ncbi:hypothetical protein FOZ61_001645, partial [Perkinsus olseni]
ELESSWLIYLKQRDIGFGTVIRERLTIHVVDANDPLLEDCREGGSSSEDSCSSAECHALSVENGVFDESLWAGTPGRDYRVNIKDGLLYARDSNVETENIDKVKSFESIIDIDKAKSFESTIDIDKVKSFESTIDIDKVKSFESTIDIDKVKGFESTIDIDKVKSLESTIEIDQVKSFKSAFQEDGPASNIGVENIETRAGIESVKNRKAGEELHSRLPVQYPANGLPTVAVRLQDQVTSVALLDSGATDAFVSAYIVNSSRWKVVLPKWVLRSCARVKPGTSDTGDYLLFSGDKTTPHGGGPETGDVAIHTAEEAGIGADGRG